MIKKFGILAGLLTLSSSAVVSAIETPSYKFVEMGYKGYSFDAIDSSEFGPKGLYLKGSFDFREYFYVTGEYSSTSDRINGPGGSASFDIGTSSLGLGAKYEASDGFTVYGDYSIGTLAYKDTVSDSHGSESEEVDLDLQLIRLGLRAQFSESLELNFGITSTKIEEDSFESGYQFGFLYEFSDNIFFSFDTSTVAGDIDQTTTTFGLRRNF